jgi:predicted HAD superfamily Cof-like phosphohydrolase
MNKYLKDIDQFHKRFGYHQCKTPSIPQEKTDLVNFRIKFIEEELSELKVAIGDNNVENALDALVDLTYVILGTAWLFNLPFDAAWSEVHKANMKKIRARSERSEFYDCVKPVGWTPPNLTKVLKEGKYENDD